MDLNSGHVVLLGALASLCSCIAPPPAMAPAQAGGPALGSLVGTVGVSFRAPEELEAIADGAMARMLATPIRELEQRADLNSRPVHVWRLSDDEGLSGLLVLGHAERECCAELSARLRALRVERPALDEWNSYGIGLLSSDGDSEQRAALERLAAELDALRDEDLCGGQLIMHELERARLDAMSSETARISRQSCELARATGKVIAARVHVDEVPVVAPLYAGERRLSFTLSAEQVQGGAPFAPHLTTNQAARELRELRQILRQVDELLRLIPLLGPKPDELWVRAEGVQRWVSGGVAKVRATVNAAQPRLTKLDAWCQNRLTIQRLFKQVNGADVEMCALVASRLRHNRTQLRALPKAGSISVEFYEYEKIITEPNPLHAELPHLRSAQLELRRALEQLARYPIDAVDDGFPSLIDALLRGWPATFTEAEVEQAFDVWAVDNQARIWAAALDSIGDQAGHEHSPAQFLASNVYFDVARAGDSFEVVPRYVHDADFEVVCAPDQDFAVYESVAADSNLNPSVPRPEEDGDERTRPALRAAQPVSARFEFMPASERGEPTPVSRVDLTLPIARFGKRVHARHATAELAFIASDMLGGEELAQLLGRSPAPVVERASATLISEALIEVRLPGLEGAYYLSFDASGVPSLDALESALRMLPEQLYLHFGTVSALNYDGRSFSLQLDGREAPLVTP